MRYITGRPLPPAESGSILNKAIQDYADPNPTYRIWAIRQKSDDRFAGTCSLITIPGVTANDVGFRIAPDYWGRGYGGETLQGLIGYAFGPLNLDFLTADTDVLNMPARRILDKYMDFLATKDYPEEGCTARVYRLERSDSGT